jgi:hypothetical protein
LYKVGMRHFVSTVRYVLTICVMRKAGSGSFKLHLTFAFNSTSSLSALKKGIAFLRACQVLLYDFVCKLLHRVDVFPKQVHDYRILE